MAVRHVDATRTTPPMATATSAVGWKFAHWWLLGLVLLSLCVRPVVELLGLPRALINVDALLTAAGAGAIAVMIFATWRRQPTNSRVMAVATTLLGVSAAVSWLLGDPRTWAGFALAYACVLLFPLALLVAAHALNGDAGRSDLVVLRFAVLLQLVFGFAQYLWRDVARIAPYGADFINGTTSHNLWPVFALPASLVLALVEKHRYRALWPVSVVLLAIYGEGKAALMVWLPGLVLFLTVDGVRRARGSRSLAALRRRMSLESIFVAGLVTMFLALVVGGLWWNTSVQGTWSVFRGHTNTLEQFVKTPGQQQGPPTLKTAARTLADDVPRSPRTALFGLGPANTVSHAAEIIVQRGGHGLHLPPPGPVAAKLLSKEGNLKFEDAQSSVLGTWGDLGSVGALLYVVAVCLATVVMVKPARRSGRALVLGLAVAYFTVGVLVGGVPLDWPEQTGVVLPLALTMLVAARAMRYGA